MAKISVIVPVYNVEPYLHRCVDSILNQSFPDFELILVDDGSPDNCGAICDDYMHRDGRVHVIHQENGGLSAARNAGIDWVFANSDSQWLVFVDSDDWIHKDFLQLLLTEAEKQNAQIAACGLDWVSEYCPDPDLKAPQPLLMCPEQAFVMHQEKCTPGPCKLIQKNLLINLRFPLGKLYEDAFVTYLILFAAERIVVFQEKLYYYYVNQDSITRARWSDRKMDGIEAHEQRLEFLSANGYHEAYRRQQEIYIEELTIKIRHLLETRSSGNEFQDSFFLLRKKLREALKAGRKTGAINWDRDILWSYMFAMKTEFVWKIAMGARKVYHNLKK